MSAGFAVAVVAAAGLWPFGGGSARDADATIGSLPKQPAAIGVRKEVPESTRAARDSYRAFLDLADAQPGMRADAMRRLADLYVAAGEQDDAAGADGAGADNFREAIRLYHQYLQEFPNRPDADRVLYSLSRAHESLGQIDESLAILDDLVRRFPASPTLAEAHFRRGERLFVTRQYAEAERAYGAVIALGEHSEFYEQALYKHGWSLFKLGQFEECLSPFLDVLSRRVKDAGRLDHGRVLDGLSKPERELVEDALRAMSLAESQLEGIRSIDGLLDRRGPVAFADLLYEGLGNLYLVQERYGDAADAYRGFVARQPAHPRAPYLQAEVIQAYAAGKFPSKVLDAEGQYVELYGLRSAYWQGVAPGDRPEVVRYLKSSLSDLASYDHERAQKTHARDAYERAAGWYRRFLDYFPGDAESPRRNFLLAEILFEAGDFAGATAEYQRTAYQYGAHEQAPEAGYAALLAAREHEKSLGDKPKSDWHTAYVEDELKFARSFPEHPQAATVQTNVAEELYARGDLQRAVSVAGEVATRIPPAAPQLDRVAWTVMAHAQFDMGRFPDAERSYIHLRQLGEDDAKKRGEIEERIAASVYRQAEAKKAAGDTDAAVAEFLRVAQAAPDSSIRPNALFDAAALLSSSGKWQLAAETLQRFRREFPQHHFNSDVTQQLAIALMNAGRNAEAATEFESVAALTGLTPEVQREALGQAADLYGKTDRKSDQQRVYEALVKRFPQSYAEAMEARQHLADLARDTGNLPQRQRWLSEIVATDGSAGAARTDRSRYLAAHATLELAEPERDAFAAVRLTAPLKESLKAKKKRMEAALAAYGKAAAYGVADVTTAATYSTAEIYYRLSRDLLASDRPAKLNKDELEQYQLLLEEQAFPFEEKAIELHDANAGRAASGIYDQWVRQSFARLADLSPARYARSEQTESYVAEID